VTRLALLLLSLAAVAWTQIAPPQVGFTLDASSSFRPVYGITGNFLLGDPVLGGVTSAAFSGTFGLAKTDSALLALDRIGQILTSLDVEPGPALFAFTADGSPAVAYLPASNQWWRWMANSFHEFKVDNTDPVVSIAAGEFIVQRDGVLWDVHFDQSQAALEGVTQPAILLTGGGLLYRNDAGLVLRKADGSEKQIDAVIPDCLTLQHLGDSWVQVGRRLAIRVTERREQLYRLPETGQ
jgi:hypothetical protein